MKKESMLEAFDALPEPVIAAREGCIVYENLAARRLFVESVVGRRAEELFDQGLLPPAAVPASGVFRHKEAEYAVTAADLDGARLLVMTPPGPKDEGTNRVLRLFTESVRSGLGSVFLSLSLITEKTPGIERESFIPILARGDKSACVLARTSDNYARVFCGLDEVAVESPLDLHDLVEEVVRTVSSLETSEQPTIHVESGGPLPYVGDGRLLEIMLMHLLSNAIKYAGPGARIAVSVKEGRRCHTITVSDNGPGVRPELLRDVFEAYRSPFQHLEPRAGAGLGLKIVRNIAALHGGNAVMESVYGNGAAVTVCLPRRDPELQGELHSGYRNDASVFLIQLSDVLDSSVYERRETI